MAGDGQHRASLAERAGVASPERAEASKAVLAQIEEHGLISLRLAFADQHGVLRGKTLLAADAADIMANGCAMTSSLLLKDTSHRSVFPVWQAGAGLGMSQLEGAGNFIILPDPDTFRILPWLDDTGWLLCDCWFDDATPVPFCSRQILKKAIDGVTGRGWRYVTGLEVEFHVFKVTNTNLTPEHATQPGTPPDVSLMTQGFQYLTEQRGDELEPVTRLLQRASMALDLPLKSIETEFGPSQVEFTFGPQDGLKTADNMVLFRSAVKQICHRQGLHASFMCRPQIDNLFACGWHLHQSLVDATTGENLFTPTNDSDALSHTGLHFAGGLLAHAAQASVFACPTINGYKRYQPHALAPDRIIWSRDNKGAMIRVISAPGDPASRIENRAGEPAANPYLYLSSQVYAGLDGIDKKFDPGPPSAEPYNATAAKLPTSLQQAVEAFGKSDFFRRKLGDHYVDYLSTIKRAEIDRFMATVTDWEHREYFDVF